MPTPSHPDRSSVEASILDFARAVATPEGNLNLTLSSPTRTINERTVDDLKRVLFGLSDDDLRAVAQKIPGQQQQTLAEQSA